MITNTCRSQADTWTELFVISDRSSITVDEGKVYSSLWGDNGSDRIVWLAQRKDGFSSLQEDDFWKRARDKELVIFVHGCCVSFNEMVDQSRGLCQGLDMHFPREKEPLLVAFDWATPKSYYPGSLKTMDTAQGRFDSFMDEIRAHVPDAKISVVMHSLGGNMMVRYLCKRSRDGKASPSFKNLIFSRPDMPLEVFRHHLDEVANASNSTLILAAHNDININLSGFMRSLGGMNQSSYRLGQIDSARELDGEVQVMDVSSLRLGHKIPYSLIGALLAP